MKCAQCHKVIEEDHKYYRYQNEADNIDFCCVSCFEAYRGENLIYKDYKVTIKMYITPPSGAQLIFDMSVEPYAAEAKEKINELPNIYKCRLCKSVIEPGTLHITSRCEMFCSLKCYDSFHPHNLGSPLLKRLKR